MTGVADAGISPRRNPHFHRASLGASKGYPKSYPAFMHFICCFNVWPLRCRPVECILLSLDWLLHVVSLVSYVQGPIEGCCLACEQDLFNSRYPRIEALVVVCAIDWAAHLPDKPRRILVRTDSLNTVDIFHSLAAEPNYMLLLLKTVKLIMDFGVALEWMFMLFMFLALDALLRLLFPVAS